MLIKNIIKSVYNNLNSFKIIAAHHVTDSIPFIDSCIISPNNFKKYIINKKFISFHEGINNFSKYTNYYILTIDDALDNLYTEIYPICKKNNIPFIAFISVDLLDNPGYITTEQLIEMSKSPLVTIGSHGCSHIKLTECNISSAYNEIFSSKEKLEKLINKRVDLIAYPNGAVNKNILKLTKKAGYTHGFGVIPRKCNAVTKLLNKYSLPRYNLTNDTVNTLN